MLKILKNNIPFSEEQYKEAKKELDLLIEFFFIELQVKIFN